MTIHPGAFSRLALIGAAALALAGTARADDAPQAAGLTYATDIAPVFYKHCAVCHRPGQVAPMSLLSFKDVRPWVKSIKKVVQERSMPPWDSDGPQGVFDNDPRLSDEDIAKISQWVDQGAAVGDPREMPPSPKYRDDEWKIGRPDGVFKMTSAFTLSDSLEDHYQNFMVPTGLTEDKWVTKIEFKPGDREVVHHILAFVVPPGGKGQKGLIAAGQEGDLLTAAASGGGLLAKYAPGNNPDVFPPGVGKKLKAGSNILFQIHYHKEPGPGTARKDQSSVGVVYSRTPVKDPVTTAWIVNPILNILPGADNVKSSSNFNFMDDGVIYSLFPHMHLRGKAFKFEAVYPGGETEVLLDVPKYRFDWQISYVFKEPKHIPKGTKVRAYAVWDNSANNPNNPDPAATVTWGEATTDEMMLGLMDYAYTNMKDQQGMLGLPDAMVSMLPPELRSQIGNLGAGGAGIDLKSIDTSKLGNLKGLGGAGALQNLRGRAVQPGGK